MNNVIEKKFLKVSLLQISSVFGPQYENTKLSLLPKELVSNDSNFELDSIAIITVPELFFPVSLFDNQILWSSITSTDDGILIYWIFVHKSKAYVPIIVISAFI